jgi:ornithine cyclodeaminase/alanine dehydrogenase-like protein (mu-crystallin family)
MLAEHHTPVLRLDQIRALIRPADVLACTRQALIAHGSGGATSPFPWHLDVAESGGEVHVKGALLHGQPHFAVKIATGFTRNADLGEPTSNGLVVCFNTATGRPAAVLMDEGYLTELRTAAAAALSVDALARADVDTVALIGAGGQARFALQYLLEVRRPSRLIVAARNNERASMFATWARTIADWTVQTCGSPAEAAGQADVIITVTPSKWPLVLAEHVRPGTHLTGVGSDSPGKRELDPAILRRAAIIAVDDLSQSRTLGELQGFDDEQISALPTVSLGAVLDGSAIGRTSLADITVADLTGLGAQDAALAAMVTQRALAAPSVIDATGLCS